MEGELEEGYMDNNRIIGKLNKDINWEEIFLKWLKTLTLKGQARLNKVSYFNCFFFYDHMYNGVGGTLK